MRPRTACVECMPCPDSGLMPHWDPLGWIGCIILTLSMPHFTGSVELLALSQLFRPFPLNAIPAFTGTTSNKFTVHGSNWNQRETNSNRFVLCTVSTFTGFWLMLQDLGHQNARECLLGSQVVGNVLVIPKLPGS